MPPQPQDQDPLITGQLSSLMIHSSKGAHLASFRCISSCLLEPNGRLVRWSPMIEDYLAVMGGAGWPHWWAFRWGGHGNSITCPVQAPAPALPGDPCWGSCSISHAAHVEIFCVPTAVAMGMAPPRRGRNRYRRLQAITRGSMLVQAIDDMKITELTINF